MISVPAGLKVPGVSRFPLGGVMADWGYAVGWLLVRAMPEFAARNVFDVGALVAARNGGPEQLRKNLARVIGVPPCDVPGTLIRASLASYARYWREVFRLPTMDHRTLARQLNDSVAGKEHLAAALAAGRGAILALPHSGNWDMAGCGWRRPTAGSPRSPSGSNPSRSTGVSSTTARAWASRCCRCPAARVHHSSCCASGWPTTGWSA
ncbi:phosphatidylinositol mannoside acyltransferase [Mycobacterium xenopi 3993]|nr:phosphatidylinositol mannoside acyltransferase [Mycobacterium xenopi 3993]